MKMWRSLGFGLALAVAACSTGKDVPAAEASVKAFHDRLGAGQIDAIVASSGPELSAPETKPRFTQLLAVVARKLGQPKAAKQVGWNDQVTTGGHFITLNYASDYARGKAAETFAFRVVDGKPVLIGYNVNSDALILN